MSFRLALVGHGSSIREIQEIVAETFENIETVGIEMPSDERVDEAAQALRRCLPELPTMSCWTTALTFGALPRSSAPGFGSAILFA